MVLKKLFSNYFACLILVMLKVMKLGFTFIDSVQTLIVNDFPHFFISKRKYEEIGLIWSTKQHYPLALTLSILVTKNLGYFLCENIAKSCLKQFMFLNLKWGN
jgi:hypothetical protein